MAQQVAGGVREKIVTLESLQPPITEGLESRGRGVETPEERLRVERYYQIMERLRQETADTGSKLMITVPDREVSILQSELARQAADARALESGGLEVKFGAGIGGGDWLGWIFSLFNHIDRSQAHPMVRPTTTTPDRIPDNAKIAMTADWGTGLYGAPKIAQQMKKIGGFELLMHLGDIYYSGTEDEVQERFLNVWPTAAGKRTVAVNSNHEMYSGGFGYYKLALPKIGQKSSYLAFENTHWLLVVLDTAYVDHDMDNEQVAWLNLVIRQSAAANSGKAKKLMLFSHQQLFSRLGNQGPKLQAALRHLLDAKAITAWYWGHEHQSVIYDAHPHFGLLGRCLGNGGIPEVRKREVIDAPTERSIGSVTWKRLSATSDSPSCLALDGPNPDVVGEEDRFVPHGFMTIELNGPRLTERVLLANGQEILKNEFV
jgi:Calcineurin-like phosphoesterase